MARTKYFEPAFDITAFELAVICMNLLNLNDRIVFADDWNGLVDPKTGAKLIVSNSTVGMRIAYQELKERTQFMRQLRGDNVFPFVMLAEAQMRTSFGMKLRPNFEIVEWRALGAPSAPAIAAAADPPKDKTVAKPTAGEIVDDSIPFDDGVPGNL